MSDKGERKGEVKRTRDGKKDQGKEVGWEGRSRVEEGWGWEGSGEAEKGRKLNW